MFIRSLIVLSLCLAVLTLPGQAQDASLKLTPVKLTFINTTAEAVSLFFVRIDDDGNQSELPYAPDLPSEFQHVQQSAAGQIWRVKAKGEIIAEYEATENIEQLIDIYALAVEQAPVEIVFQNTSDQEVDVYWVAPDGKETLYAPKLPPMREHVQEAVPGQLWRVKQAGIVVGEYAADHRAQQPVDLAFVISNFQPPVDLVFRNDMAQPVDIFWVDLNDQEILYAADLAVDDTFSHPSYPLQLWRVRQNGTLVGEYQPTDVPVQQVINLDALAKETAAAMLEITRQPPAGLGTEAPAAPTADVAPTGSTRGSSTRGTN